MNEKRVNERDGLLSEMGNTADKEEPPNEAADFLEKLAIRLWFEEDPVAGESARATDELKAPEEMEGEERANMVLPRDVWLIVLGKLESARDLGRLCMCCKSYRRIVLQANKLWEDFDSKLQLLRVGTAWGTTPRERIAYIERVFLGDRLFPDELEMWRIVAAESMPSEIRVLVASLGDVGPGKSNLIARFVRGAFIRDTNRMSLQLEVQEHRKKLTLSEGLSTELSIQECPSGGDIDQYVATFDSDVVIVVSTFEDSSSFSRDVTRLCETLQCRDMRVPIVAVRSRSDRFVMVPGASEKRRLLASFRMPYLSTSAFLDTNCTEVFEVAAKLAIAASPARRKKQKE
jgi:hypothetical protein